LRAQQAEVAEAIDLAQDFAQLVRQRQPARLDPWLECAATSALEALQCFAKGICEDYDAGQSRRDTPLEYRPCGGAYQSPQNAQAPDVWASAPRSLEPPLRVCSRGWAGVCPIRGTGGLATSVETGMMRHDIVSWWCVRESSLRIWTVHCANF
jgi:hypothetical protein